MDIKLLFKITGAGLITLAGLSVGISRAEGEVRLVTEVRCASDLSAEDAKLYGVPREKGRGILFARVVEKNGKDSPAHGQIYAGATCKHAGLLSLPLYRTRDDRMMADFRHVSGDTCRFLVHASSGGNRLKSDFVYTFPN